MAELHGHLFLFLFLSFRPLFFSFLICRFVVLIEDKHGSSFGFGLRWMGMAVMMEDGIVVKVV